MIEKKLPNGGGASETTEPAAGSSTGTDVSLRDYFVALRAADVRLEKERDRRYSEIAQEKEKALKIKEEADKEALGLAREIQKYKDEKANELREQISSERGDYMTRSEYNVQQKSMSDSVSALNESVAKQLKPITEYIALQQGRQGGVGLSSNVMAVAITIMISVLAVTIAGVSVLTR